MVIWYKWHSNCYLTYATLPFKESPKLNLFIQSTNDSSETHHQEQNHLLGSPSVSLNEKLGCCHHFFTTSV